MSKLKQILDALEKASPIDTAELTLATPYDAIEQVIYPEVLWSANQLAGEGVKALPQHDAESTLGPNASLTLLRAGCHPSTLTFIYSVHKSGFVVEALVGVEEGNQVHSSSGESATPLNGVTANWVNDQVLSFIHEIFGGELLK